MSKSYTTTKRKLGITEQAVGAVLSSCSCDVGSRLPRSRTDLRDAKSKEVKSEFHFTLNDQGSSPDETAIVFFCEQGYSIAERGTWFFYVCCRIDDGLLLFIPLRCILWWPPTGRRLPFGREKRGDSFQEARDCFG